MEMGYSQLPFLHAGMDGATCLCQARPPRRHSLGPPLDASAYVDEVFKMKNAAPGNSAEENRSYGSALRKNLQRLVEPGSGVADLEPPIIAPFSTTRSTATRLAIVAQLKCSLSGWNLRGGIL